MSNQKPKQDLEFELESLEELKKTLAKNFGFLGDCL